MGSRVSVDVDDGLPTGLPQDDRERSVVRVWRAAGLKDGTIATYLWPVRRFRAYCRSLGVDEVERMTAGDVIGFARSYTGPRAGRRVKVWIIHTARSAVHAWRCGLEQLGVPVPAWRSAAPPRAWPRLIEEYARYRQAHRGAAPRTIVRDRGVASDLVNRLRSNGRRISGLAISDIDALVEEWSGRLARRTVADHCSSLRCFLRFLRTTGRIRWDAAPTIIAPRYRVDERPPRALPWDTVRRLLRAIPRDRGLGRRDYAMFLLMATYGLGAGEVVRLRLDDVDWRGGVLRARRPKTEVPIELPLLPSVARALAAYLRRGRPPARLVREIFLTASMPHRQVTTSVLRHQVRQYATRAGIRVAVLGAHVFRHSHATRQVDAGVSLKVIGDILGHRKPSSTSVYVRLALQRLRGVGLPVPR